MSRELDLAVKRACLGDPQAVSAVVAAIRPLVQRYCRFRLRGTDGAVLSAEDLTQEICFAVVTALPRYRNEGRPFQAFVYGVAANKIADAYRKAARNKSDSVADFPDLVCADPGPEQSVLDRESGARVRELLSVLPERQRRILYLRIVEGMSGEETAAALGCTVGSVRVGQHRALARLRTRLAATEQGRG